MISNTAPSANVSAFSNVACLFANSSAHDARTAFVTVMSHPVTLPAPVNVERTVGRLTVNCIVAPDSTRTGVFDGTTLTAYANGAKVFEQTIAAVQDTNDKLVFGAYDKDCWQGHFIGLFDEFRLRDAVSSADWVKAEYDQASASFLSAGPATDVTGGARRPRVAFLVD